VALRLVVVLLALAVITTSVILSPLSLGVLRRNLGNVNWGRLGHIAQTYGAVSAIIAAIALVGVVVSLIIQSREAKAARTNSLRALHVELLKMAMDDPAYNGVLGRVHH
jgi:thiosulfate reductase cytochrome b subunit